MDSKILQTLHKDHVRQSELLDLIDEELCHFDAETSGPNFELVALALEYCVDYPGHYHHPAEDAIYARLLLRKPALKHTLVALDRDHETLAALTDSLAVAVSSAIGTNSAEKACNVGARFVRHYRQHMAIEESDIFPAAREYLDAADWEAVAAEIALPEDPLFDEHIREAYLGLQRRIIERQRELHS